MSFLAILLLLAGSAAAREPAVSFDRGMGPFRKALDVARRWNPDACWAGLDYDWEPVKLDGPRGPKTENDYTERFTYYFLSPKWPEVVYSVIYIDQPSVDVVTRGIEDTQNWGRGEAPLGGCLGRADVSIGQALAKARGAGLAVATATVEAALRAVPREKWEGACRTYVGLGFNLPKSCPERLRRVLRAARGGEVWRVQVHDRDAFVDAVSGRVLK